MKAEPPVGLRLNEGRQPRPVADERQLGQAAQRQPVAQRGGVARRRQRAHTQDRRTHRHAALQRSPQPGPQRYRPPTAAAKPQYHTRRLTCLLVSTNHVWDTTVVIATRKALLVIVITTIVPPNT